jgi:hypothetical protein
LSRQRRVTVVVPSSAFVMMRVNRKLPLVLTRGCRIANRSVPCSWKAVIAVPATAQRIISAVTIPLNVTILPKYGDMSWLKCLSNLGWLSRGGAGGGASSCAARVCCRVSTSKALAFQRNNWLTLRSVRWVALTFPLPNTRAGGNTALLLDRERVASAGGNTAFLHRERVATMCVCVCVFKLIVRSGYMVKRRRAACHTPCH